MNKNYFIIPAILIIVGFFTLITIHAQASGAGLQDAINGLNQTATGQGGNLTGGAGYGEARELPQVVSGIVQSVLGFLGVIFIIFIIVSGFQWMTAGGNSDTITKAKDRMINATIGLIIVMAAYTISYFVINTLVSQTGFQG